MRLKFTVLNHYGLNGGDLKHPYNGNLKYFYKTSLFMGAQRDSGA